MKNSSWVSVVCLCYNQARFVQEAITSVLQQTYDAVQLVVVDDASTDGSRERIQNAISGRANTLFVPLTKNIGNCRAFNIGLSRCKGDFIIDLAADDILLPERIERGIDVFRRYSSEYGVHFSDAELIDESGVFMQFHSDRFPHNSIPQGEVYTALIVRYFINASTMMVRREVFDKIGGYDEVLAYEDFDFWIRSARDFKYCYTPQPLVKRRMVQGSLATRQFTKGSPQMESTYRICKKIEALNRTREEDRALRSRLSYEMVTCLKTGNFWMAIKYLRWWMRLNKK